MATKKHKNLTKMTGVCKRFLENNRYRFFVMVSGDGGGGVWRDR